MTCSCTAAGLLLDIATVRLLEDDIADQTAATRSLAGGMSMHSFDQSDGRQGGWPVLYTPNWTTAQSASINSIDAGHHVFRMECYRTCVSKHPPGQEYKGSVCLALVHGQVNAFGQSRKGYPRVKIKGLVGCCNDEDIA
jgi:hypothetical protein